MCVQNLQLAVQLAIDLELHADDKPSEAISKGHWTAGKGCGVPTFQLITFFMPRCSTAMGRSPRS